MDSTLPNRQSIRMKAWDYTRPGWYFVTFNTQGSKALFGTVVNGRMVVNEAGRIASAEWQKSGTLRQNLALDEFVIMPNHVHGLVRIVGRGLDASSPHDASSPSAAAADRGVFGKPVAGALGTFVGAYKAAVSREIGRRGLVHQTRTGQMHQTRTGQVHQTRTGARPGTGIWHRNYWDVIVRDAKALENIRRYIRHNPQNYQVVLQGTDPRYLGDRALLEKPTVGFLASRGTATQHGNLPLSKGEVIISGFLSPMELALFRAGLKNKKAMIWVKPWGLADSKESPNVRQAIEAGRLLVISPFDDTADEPAVRRAAWCNEYVLAHCNRVVIGHLNPDGMLACVLSEADPELEIMYL